MASNGRRIRATVVVNGDDVYEDLFGACLALTDIATEAGFATGRQVGMGRLPDSAIYVLYTATGECTIAQQDALVDRVCAGTGLVALHASNVLNANEPLYS